MQVSGQLCNGANEVRDLTYYSRMDLEVAWETAGQYGRQFGPCWTESLPLVVQLKSPFVS